MSKPKFYQAVLKPVEDVLKEVYPHDPELTMEDRMGNDNAECPECGKMNGGYYLKKVLQS
jgi:hypothetical protein